MNTPDDQPEQGALHELRQALDRLDSNPEVGTGPFERIAESARDFVESADPSVAHAARQLELRAFSLLLARQADELRLLGRQLMQLARALPAPFPELN